jgi:predicted RNA-binding Zn-ribbon protein involved in translation (DUF1610 family)
LTLISIYYITAFSLAAPAELRCPKCGHVGTYNCTNSIFSHNYIENVHTKEELGIDHKDYLRTITREESETEPRSVYSNGKEVTRPMLTRIYKCTYKVYAVFCRYQEYTTTYKTKIYNDHYKCEHCGFADQKERKGERKLEKVEKGNQVVLYKKDEEILANTELIKYVEWEEKIR